MRVITLRNWVVEKETIKWLDLVLVYGNNDLEKERAVLINEGEQIRRILSAIITKLGG